MESSIPPHPHVDSQFFHLGDKEQLVSRFRPLVRRAVGQAHADSQDRDDLEQAGYLGLLVASERFQPLKGTPFPAYAKPFVAGYIKHAHGRDKRFYSRHLPIGDANPAAEESFDSGLHSAREVGDFVKRLPTDLRYIAKRVFWDNATQAEIADELGLSRRTIVGRLKTIRILGQLSLEHLRDIQSAA